MAGSIVFVSHSSGSDGSSRDFTRSVCDALSARFTVRWDDSLTAGGSWRQEIHEWMAECHAGVVLLSKRAIKESDWVLKEATILSWRRSLDPSFKLVPVLVGDARLEDLEGRAWAPLLLREVQILRDAGSGPATAEQIAAAIPDNLRCSPTPLRVLTEHVADLLEANVPETALLREAERAGVATNWVAGRPGARRLAEAIAREILRDGALGVEKWVTRLHGALSSGEALDLLRLVDPFWVPIDAAGRLPDIVGRGDAAALNGVVPSATAGDYLRRAFWPELLVPLFKCDALGTRPRDELLRNLKAEVASRYTYCAEDTGEIERLLLDPPARWFVLVPRHVPLDDLAGLMADYPKLTFIMHTGPRLSDSDVKKVLNIELLYPELDPTVERAAHALKCTVRLKLKGD